MVERPFRDTAEQVTRNLVAASAGEARAAAALLPLVYEDLRRLAAARLVRLGPGQTLQATALVHEAYLRVVGTQDLGWRSRAHFFGAAARAMRNILIDHLRGRDALKRRGHGARLHHDTTAGLASEGPSDDLLALTQELGELEREHPRKAEVVTLRFFGGLEMNEIAELLGLTTRTVERDWRFARAWLNSRLAEPEAGP